ncbi:glycosyltransferase [Candidatus Saccharibacteria bacterium]|nr:glycosyltransferase [Candidatus Saccharibacteria bacterium]
MKIAVFTDAYLEVASGIASSIRAQKQDLERLGHEVVLFCPGLKGSVAKLPAKERKNVIVVPTCRVWHFGGVPMARNPETVKQFILEKYPNFAQFDIVHVHYEAGCSLAGVMLARQFKVPLVQTMHGREDSAIAVNVPHPFKAFVATILNWAHAGYIPHTVKVHKDDYLATSVTRAKMWELMVNHANVADIVITPSKHFAKKLKHYGVKKPIRPLSNGVADDLLVKGAKVRELKEGEPLKIIWHSRISREKRFRGFLLALKDLDVPYELYAYGNGNDFLVAQAMILRWNLKAKLYGSMGRKEIFNKMSECHISALTSYNFDTQSMTLLEAEATGCPVFFCDPDMKEVVPKGSYVCAKEPSAKAMAEALRDLAGHPERVKEMSQVMLKHRKEILQSNKINELISIYNEVK